MSPVLFLNPNLVGSEVALANVAMIISAAVKMVATAKQIISIILVFAEAAIISSGWFVSLVPESQPRFIAACVELRMRKSRAGVTLA